MPGIVLDNPTWRFILLTPTVASVPLLHLRDTITQIHAGLNRMTQRAGFAPVAWIRNTEVTISYETGVAMAHPHTHLLCAVPDSYFDAPLRKVKGANGRPRIVPGYMTKDQWADMWRSCMKLDYWPVLDVRAIKGDVTTTEGRKALYEITKYSTKPGDLARLDPRDFYRLYHQLKGTRTIGIGGALSPYLREVDDEGEPEAYPNVAIAATWNAKERRYLTDFTDGLAAQQEARAALNARILPEARYLARRALLNGNTHSDYERAEHVRHERTDRGHDHAPADPMQSMRKNRRVHHATIQGPDVRPVEDVVRSGR